MTLLYISTELYTAAAAAASRPAQEIGRFRCANMCIYTENDTTSQSFKITFLIQNTPKTRTYIFKNTTFLNIHISKTRHSFESAFSAHVYGQGWKRFPKQFPSFLFVTAYRH